MTQAVYAVRKIKSENQDSLIDQTYIAHYLQLIEREMIEEDNLDDATVL